MPLGKINIAAGLVEDITDYAAGPRWIAADYVRFRQAMPEKIGGWVQNGTDTFDFGSCRTLLGWNTLANVKHIAGGGSVMLQIFTGSTWVDITPVGTNGTYALDSFAVVATSAQVTVTETSHGQITGNRVTIAGASAGGGITIAGDYLVTKVDDDTYTITHSTEATSTDATTGGASATFQNYIDSGLSSSVLGEGWGIGGWGDDGWGDPSTGGTDIFPARTWSLVNWGEDLLASPRGAGLYTWDASVGTGTRAVAVSNAPTKCNYVFVSQGDRHAVVLGSDEAGGTIDPLLVHWSDQEDNTTWTAAATNTAGTFRVTEGNELISGINTRALSLIWTDTAVYSMQFIGPPYTFGFELLGKGSGIAGPLARAEAASRVFWMGRISRNFYVYDGSVRVLQCPVLRKIQEDFNTEQQDLVCCIPNTQFNEVWWFYPSAGSNENDRYVIYNYLEETWVTGTMGRTAGIDIGLFQNPMWMDADTKLYSQEDGVDAAGSAISSYIETGEYEVGSGDRLMLLDKLILDADITGNLDITIYTRRYPNATQITKGPYTATSSDGKISFRAKGRQFALRFASDGIGDDWRMGHMRMQTKITGGR